MSKPKHKPLVRRPTTMADAFNRALQDKGFDTTSARMPMKREPTWSVTRRKR